MAQIKNKFGFVGYLVDIIILLLIGLSVVLIAITPHENHLAKNIEKKIQIQAKKHNVVYTPFNRVSNFIDKAAIASQDKRFYSDIGVDPLGNIRAITFSIIDSHRQGASTITEQLAKNAYYHDHDSLRTDIETKVLALYITQQYKKQKILEMYLNDIYYGRNSYGIYQASKTYFATTPDKLNLPQAAYLIGLINAPSYYGTNPKAAVKEANNILSEMVRDGYINTGQSQNAIKELNNFIP